MDLICTLPQFRLCSHSREGFLFEHPEGWEKIYQPGYVVYPPDAEQVRSSKMVMLSPALTVTIATLPKEEELGRYFDEFVRRLPQTFPGFQRLNTQHRLTLASGDEALEYEFEFSRGPNDWTAIVVVARRGHRVWNLDGSCLRSHWPTYQPILSKAVRSLSLVEDSVRATDRETIMHIRNPSGANGLGPIGEARLPRAAERICMAIRKRFSLGITKHEAVIELESGCIDFILTTNVNSDSPEYQQILSYAHEEFEIEKFLQRRIDEIIAIVRQASLGPNDAFSDDQSISGTMSMIGKQVFERCGLDGLENVSCHLGMLWPDSRLHASIGPAWAEIPGWGVALAWPHSQ